MIGVGFVRGISALDFRVVREIVSSWVITFPVTMLLSETSFLLLVFLLKGQVALRTPF